LVPGDTHGQYRTLLPSWAYVLSFAARHAQQSVSLVM
jgi:hypothetical protein